MIADINPNQLSVWTHSNTGRLVRMSKEIASASFDLEQFKAEMAEQTKTIMREMIAEMNLAKERPQVPPPPPFDLDAENLGRREIEDDQETLLATPIARPM